MKKTVWLIYIAIMVALPSYGWIMAPVINGVAVSGGSSGTATMLAAADVAQISLSSTDTWETTDLDSTYGSLPGTTSGAILVAIGDGNTFGVRESGNTNYTLTTSLYNGTRTTVYVKVDASNQIDIYRGSSGIAVYLVGYFDGSHTWLSSPVEVTPGSTGWQDVNLSAYASANSVFALFEVQTSGGGRNVGFRYNGSADDHVGSYNNNHMWAIMPIDGSDIVEANVEDTAEVDIYLIGFVDCGTARTSGGSSITPGTAGDWYDITLPDTGHSIAVLEIYAGGTYSFDLRANGGTAQTSMYADCRRAGNWPVVAIDGSDLAEMYVEDNTVETYVWGYLD